MTAADRPVLHLPEYGSLGNLATGHRNATKNKTINVLLITKPYEYSDQRLVSEAMYLPCYW